MVNAAMTDATAGGPGPFERFLRWLSSNRDQALKMHEQLQKKITQFFIRKGCLDSQELFSETRQRIIDIICSGRAYDNPQALFYTVARIVWLEERRKPKSEPMVDDIPECPQETRDKEMRAFCLDSCLAKLPEPHRELIIQYYAGSGQGKIEGRRRLAASYGSDNSVRIKTFRIRAALRMCIGDCLNRAAN